MGVLYDAMFIIFALFYFPYFLLKRKYHKDILQRLGIFEKDIFKDIAPSKPIWIHAVSVGEMKTAEILIEKIRQSHPSKKFVVSNTTQTGHKIAATSAKKGDAAIYFPIDLSFVVRRLIDLVNPSVFIVIETEIWPNLITELEKKGVPIVLVNGRISSKSFRRYRLIKPIMRDILNKISVFAMRTASDAERIKALGAPAERVQVTGNMKFDSIFYKNEKAEEKWPPIENRNVWLKESSRLVIAGSTHRGEDGRILHAYKILKRDYPDLALLIAPRHIERTNEVCALAEGAGFSAVKMSDVEKACGEVQDSIPSLYGDNSVFLLDSIGHLSSLYRLATVVFMGGSLVPHGGQNFIEPAAYAKPVITGPHLHNFESERELFESNDAIEIVETDDELMNSFRRLLTDGEKRSSMGEKAKRIVSENMGSTARNIALVEKYL